MYGHYLKYFTAIWTSLKEVGKVAWNANGGIYMRQKNVAPLRYIRQIKKTLQMFAIKLSSR